MSELAGNPYSMGCYIWILELHLVLELEDSVRSGGAIGPSETEQRGARSVDH